MRGGFGGHKNHPVKGRVTLPGVLLFAGGIAFASHSISGQACDTMLTREILSYLCGCSSTAWRLEALSAESFVPACKGPPSPTPSRLDHRPHPLNADLRVPTQRLTAIRSGQKIYHLHVTFLEGQCMSGEKESQTSRRSFDLRS